MKKFTKLFLSCAAVAAVAAAVGISAMAADITGDVKGTFDETAKTVTIDATTSDITPDQNTQVTFLVFKGAVDTDISADSVKGIDQGTTVQPANNGLKSDVTVPEEGQDTYTVKVGYYKGGTFTVKSGTFKLGTAAGAKYYIGDINLDGKVLAAQDATMELWYGVNNDNASYTNTPITFTDDTLNTNGKNTSAVGDINLDGTVLAAQDATMLLWYGVDNSKASNSNKLVQVSGLPENYIEPKIN